MGQIIRVQASDELIKDLSKTLSGYVKFVVDVERGILAAGSARHFDDEQALLADGSKQSNLWGGGLDLETGEIDFDSMINLRPRDGNTSREVLDITLRAKIEEIARSLLR